MSTREHQQLRDLLRLPQNARCVDCAVLDPKWASFSLGYFMCIECSGIHRMLGTHITKVKSTTLDTWKPEYVEVVRRRGNVSFNAEWEARLPAGKTIDAHTGSAERERFIRAKYERQAFRGTATRDSYARAAAKMGCAVDESGALSPAVSGSDSPTAAAAAAAPRVSPAVARRLAAKKAKEAEERNKKARAAEAAEAAKRAAEAEAKAAAEVAKRAAEAEARAAAETDVGELFGPAAAAVAAVMAGGGGGDSGHARSSSALAAPGATPAPARDLPVMLGSSAAPAVSLPPIGTLGPLPSPSDPLADMHSHAHGHHGLPGAQGSDFPGSAGVPSAAGASKVGPPGSDADGGMTQEEAKAAAEKALLSAMAEIRRLQSADWEATYGELGSVAEARKEQASALEEHKAVVDSLGEAFDAAQRALAKKFEKLEASAVEAQRTRMFNLQRAAGALQRKEYEATMYDIAPRSQPAPERPSPEAEAQSNGFAFA
ncbi:hypothetical protein FNF29_04152 [Cafeteria roenbergensis]|uniref:Arf-GAP domain-containing protein n=1 Tax=Cafeteria roenbergensis TaxID=33653 RepID=A0A5A8CGV3_CAFRO|nr:hypothetical protein FNF29_04152 [Cafeteria roenbergensis]|eukprot:KAA0152038.1 hypothetical protein FNF29_04152 [Cafeteria roenbergensis]